MFLAFFSSVSLEVTREWTQSQPSYVDPKSSQQDGEPRAELTGRDVSEGGTRQVKEVTTGVCPLGKCQQDPLPGKLVAPALGAWPAGLGCSRGGITELAGGGDGAGGEDRLGTAHVKAWEGIWHSSDGLQQGARVG